MIQTPRFVILDQDDVAFQPWKGLEEVIDECFTDALERALQAQMIFITRDCIKTLVQKSYAEKGVATTLFVHQYNIDEIAVMRDYHRRLLDDHVLPQFEAKSAPFKMFYKEMQSLIHTAVQNKVRFGMLTHGDHAWAQEVPVLTGLHALVPFRRGIDSYNLRRKNKDRSLYYDFLRDADFRGSFESVSLIDDRQDNVDMANAAGLRGLHVDIKGGNGPDNTLKVLREIAREAAAYNRIRMTRAQRLSA